MHSLAQCLFSHIRQLGLLHAGERVGVAVSGGIDSVALLCLMLELRGELGLVLLVVHFNHKLRGAESERDEEFVASLAREHGLEFICDSDDVAQHAAEERVSLETAARELRYGFFRHLLREGISRTEVPSDQNRSDGAVGGGVPPERRRHESSPEPVSRLDVILTGHTLDDQAETVLMRLIRGSGLRGLGGIYPRIEVEDDGEARGEIIRPLLGIRRRELELYLREIGQTWREDLSNADESFTRNRVRKLLVPLLEKEFNPAVAENLSELAEIARGEEDYWDNEVAGWMGTGVHWSEPAWLRERSKAAGLVQISVNGPISWAIGAGQMGYPSDGQADDVLDARIAQAAWAVMNASVDRLWFLGEPVAVQRRVVKAIGDEAGIPLEFKHVEEILRFASDDPGSGKELSLPLGWKLIRQADELLFVTPDLRSSNPAGDYEYPLSVPGRVEVHEGGFTIEARPIPAGEVAEYNPDELLDADSVTGPFLVRNWRAGDRFWPAHTKSPKKIKELLQERRIAQPDRGRWPVILNNDGEIVWVRRFAAHSKYRPKPGGAAILLRAEVGLTSLKVQD